MFKSKMCEESQIIWNVIFFRTGRITRIRRVQPKWSREDAKTQMGLSDA
jgi:hypothetical protein